MLPLKLIEPIRSHLVHVKRLHAEDLKEGAGFVELPYFCDGST